MATTLTSDAISYVDFGNDRTYDSYDAVSASGALSIASASDGSLSFEAGCRALDTRGYTYKAIKRAFDLVLSAFAILVLLIPCLVLSVLIVLDTGASPIYSQIRVGKYGRLFKIYKFRTMVKDSENVEKYLSATQLVQWKRERKVDDDPRITRFGHILRATSLDELPQLINVFLGQLSLIGPRPVTQEELENFGGKNSKFLSVPSGITGLWQVSQRNNATFESGERQQIELNYVDRASLSLDAKIFFRTFAVMFGKCRTGK